MMVVAITETSANCRLQHNQLINLVLQMKI